MIRRAVVADPGWRLVVADADQMEPRVLAAISRDPGLMEVAGHPDDLYTRLSDRAFSGDRAHAKLALLGAIYGQTSGDGLKNLAALRRRFPRAVAYVDDAAKAGEEGRLVRTWLGRTSPRAVGAGEDEEAGLPQEGGEPEAAEGEFTPGYASGNARARGRFTRNFVVQGSAADWALLMLAALRRSLTGMRAELVFFQHDEVIVHCPAEEAEAVTEAIRGPGTRRAGSRSARRRCGSRSRRPRSSGTRTRSRRAREPLRARPLRTPGGYFSGSFFHRGLSAIVLSWSVVSTGSARVASSCCPLAL